MLNHFTFNGKSSAEYGLLVTALNPYDTASRRVEAIEIPYRNGNLIVDSGTYDNILVSYNVAIVNNTKANIDAINDWLAGSKGYGTLTDTVNDDIYRVACASSSIQYDLTALYREGQATITFDCWPQKYLKANDTITLPAGNNQTLTSDYNGEPIITVAQAGTITWNGEIITVNAPMTINSQTMQAYDGDTNMNNYIEVDDFPMIKKGANTISCTMALTIVPNYWKH